MLNISKYLGLIALVCSIAGLTACGGGSGTDNKKKDLLVCSGTDVILADGTCGAAPPPPPCPAGQIRPTPDQACVESDFVPPTMPASVGADQVVIYLNKADAVKDFAGYSIYTFQNCGDVWANPSNDGAGNDQWTNVALNPVTSTPETADPVYGAYFVIDLDPDSAGTCGSFIIRNNGLTVQTADLTVQTASDSPFNRRYFVIEPAAGLTAARVSNVPICINDVCAPYEKPALAISEVSAHWIKPSLILWDQTVTDVELYAANDGSKITANLDGSVAGGTKVADLAAATVAGGDLTRVPHLDELEGYAITLDEDADTNSEMVKELLKKELVIVGVTADGAKIGTRIQNYALLDELYTAGTDDADEARLGAIYDDENVTVSVWAPTAQLVELRIFSDQRTPTVDGVEGYFPSLSTYPMTFDSATGIWSYTGTRAALDRKYYRFRVTGYNYQTNSTNTLEVGDPNSVSLSADGFYSQLVDLNDDDLKPEGWDEEAPVVDSFESMSIYETHVRDFSVLDASTPAAHRGKYLAFTEADSAPVNHLKALAEAGLTHVHLLPINDGSSIREGAGKKYNLDSTVRELCNGVPTAPVCAPGQKINTNANNLSTLREVLEGYAGDSDSARKLITSLRGVDSFNWNYDPQYFNVPEGSYSTNPDGVARIIEARAMNVALHRMGLRVVLDVVYPHMAASGIKAANSTFDKIVPGYYFRNTVTSATVINNTGAGPDTATENAMMGKFLVDSVAQWAEQYKVDGFRFDQSGFIPKAVLLEAYDAVKAIDPDNYFYAEAWSAAGDNASSRVAELSAQIPLAGTGIGTFNDRIRDPLRNMALVNGGELNAVRAGLAGNLAAFKLLAKSGTTISAASVRAYNLDPQEAINYVEKHDGATLWDYMHLPNALPAGTTAAERTRIQALTLSVPLLSQGVPFIHMGSELLRSKSMDHNSYNSGDWFNFVDFTKQTNNWMVGLPVEHSATDAQILEAFADPESKPTPELIQASADMFKVFLTIGKSKLFSLETAEEVLDRVGFHDGGVTQVNNVIVMSIDDGVGTVAASNPATARADLDPEVDAVVVVFNGTGSTVNRNIATSTGFTLHSLQANGSDEVVKAASFAEGATVEDGGTFSVPAYTTAVFVKAQAGAQGDGLLSSITSGYEVPVPYGDDAIYVRGSVYDAGWSATAENQMIYQGNGIYSVALTVPATGPYEFKIANSGYSTVNLGTGTVALDTPLTLTQGGGNISVTFPAAGNYRFSLDATDTDAPVLTVVNADVFQATPMYVRGSIFDAGWSAGAGNLLTHRGDSVYDVILTNVTAAAHEFKIASTDYAVERAVDGADQDVTIGTQKAFQVGGANAKVTIPTAGDYGVKVNAKDPTAPLVSIYKDDMYNGNPIYVRGSVFDAGWSGTPGGANTMAYDGRGIYSVSLPLTQGIAYEFKVADGTYSAVNLGTGSVVLNTPLALTPNGGNIALTVATTGSYTFKLDTTSVPTITVVAD